MVASGLDPSRQFLRRVKNRPPLRRRSRVRAWFRLVVVLGGIVLGGLAAWFGFQSALSTDLLALEDVAVRGASADLAQEVEGRLELLRGRNLLSLDLASVRRRIESIPRVREASLRRRLPHSLQVEVDPRKPRAVVESTEAAVLVDDDAVILGPARPHHEGLPRIRLADPSRSPLSSADPGSRGGTDVAAALEVMSWLERTGSDLGAGLERIRLEARGVVLVLESGLEILVGDADALPGKIGAFEALLESDPPAPPAVVDVRFRDMVVVNGRR